MLQKVKLYISTFLWPMSSAKHRVTSSLFSALSYGKSLASLTSYCNISRLRHVLFQITYVLTFTSFNIASGAIFLWSEYSPLHNSDVYSWCTTLILLVIKISHLPSNTLTEAFSYITSIKWVYDKKRLAFFICPREGKISFSTEILAIEPEPIQMVMIRKNTNV